MKKKISRKRRKEKSYGIYMAWEITERQREEVGMKSVQVTQEMKSQISQNFVSINPTNQ